MTITSELVEGYFLLNKHGQFWSPPTKTLEGIEQVKEYEEFTFPSGSPYTIIKFKQVTEE